MNTKTHFFAVLAALTAATGYAQTTVVSENFEADAVGANPSGAIKVWPTTISSTRAIEVVGSATNNAGTGKALRYLNNDTDGSARVSYAFSGSPVSAARIDFSVAQFNMGTSLNNKSIRVVIGEQGVDMVNSATFFNDCRLRDDNTIDFLSSASGNDYGNALMASNNAVSIYLNDSDTEALTYVEPDGLTTNTLAANSVAYYLNGTFEFSALMENVITANGTVLTSSNNLGRFTFVGFTSDVDLDYIIDDIVVTALEDSGPPPEYLVEDDFETDTAGLKPSGPQEIRPSSPLSDVKVEVVDGAANVAGTGNAARQLDNNSGTSSRFLYTLASSFDSQHSGLAIEFSFAPLNTATNSTFVDVGVGEFNKNLTSGSDRFLDCRLYADGTVDFRGPGTNHNNNVAILTSNNTMNIFINDYEEDPLVYVGPDGIVYALETNSVAYWLNGTLEYQDHLFEVTTQGGAETTLTATNSLGRFGLITGQSAVALDYVFDNVKVKALTQDTFDGYTQWLAQYPELGTNSSMLVDFEPDGIDNLTEYALGGNPASNDVMGILPVAALNTEGGTNWLNYVYSRRVDDPALTYDVFAATDLMIAPITNDTEFAGASSPVGAFQSATNRVPADAEEKQFMQLNVEYN